MTEIRKITLQFPSLRAFLAEYGERISDAGMLLRTETPPAAGSRVEIEVVVAEGMRLLRARGEILWNRTVGNGGGQQAAAVRFLDLDEASRKLIDKIVDQRRREGAEPFSLEAVPGPREARLRDLTVPAAPASVQSGEHGESAGDAIFELAAPPAAGGIETPRQPHRPTPPVPLLAEPEPAPFDLGPGPTAGGEESALPGPQIESAATSGEQRAAETPFGVDMTELFGGDESEMEASGERTRAFPPDFVDEVEAELEAVPSPEISGDSFSVVDTREVELRPGTPPGESVAAPAPPIEPPPAPRIGPSPAPPVGRAVEPSPAPEAALASDSASEREPETAAPPPPEIEPASDAGEAPPEAAAEASPAPPSAPETEPLPEPKPKPDGEPVAAAEPPRPAVPPQPPEGSLRPARAFNTDVGPETVEIPILKPPSAAKPATEATPPAEPPVLPALDDNLLSIPELEQSPTTGEVQAAPAAPADLPNSAEALRGAASRQRHLGTWLLIGLLVGALAVAGYLLLGLMRQGGASSASQEATTTPAAPSAAPVAQADRGPDEEVAPAANEATTGPTDDQTEPASPAPAVAEEGQAEPQPPLTVLNRITWTESETETTLALVADGAFALERARLVPIAGGEPRLVIKISGIERAFQPAVLAVNTSHVRRVRTGLHAGGELHVVVDLARPGIAARDVAARGSRLEVRLGEE